MTELKQQLTRGGNGGNDSRVHSKIKYSNGPVEIELQKMQEWRRKDAQIDEGIQ